MQHGWGPGQLIDTRALTANETLVAAARTIRVLVRPVSFIIVVLMGVYQLAASMMFERAFGGIDLDGLEVDGWSSAISGEQFASMLLWAGTALIVGMLVSVVVGGSIVVLAESADRRHDIRTRDAVRISFDHAGATLGATVLLLTGAFGTAMVLLIIQSPLGMLVPVLGAVTVVATFLSVGFVAGALSYLILPVAILEQLGPVRTLKRAWWTLRHRPARVCGMTALASMVAISLSVLVSVLFIPLAALASGAELVWSSLNAIAISLVSIPLFTVLAMVVYLDAVTRIEGVDLRLRDQAGAP
ncbi:MAG: hypothetical protein WD576_04890 [Nitriliruptoraceae bacterium]